MYIRFGIGNDGGVVTEGIRGLQRSSLGQIEEACRVLGLDLKSVSIPDEVVGRSRYQWFVGVDLDGERVHFVGNSEPGAFDYRGIGWAENLVEGNPPTS